MESGDPLVSAEWLLKNFDAPDIRVLDATFFADFTNPPETGRQVWARGHIPGATYFDIDHVADDTSPYPHMMPDAVKFSSRIRKLGVGDGNRIVVYDQNRFFASARVWWMLRVMGHTDVHVLDGGLAAWVEAGGELEDMPPIVSERHFTPRVRSDLVMDAAGLEKAVGSARLAIIDSRPVFRPRAGTPRRPEVGPYSRQHEPARQRPDHRRRPHEIRQATGEPLQGPDGTDRDDVRFRRDRRRHGAGPGPPRQLGCRCL